MSAQVASKNLYELLGNDHEEDSDKEPEPPTRAIEKPLPRTSKRNAPDPGAAARGGAAPERGGRGGRRGGFTGSEEAFRDRAAGSVNSRGKPEDGVRQDRHPDRLARGRGDGAFDGRGRGRGRGARGGRDDRHSRSQQTDSEKQVSQGWGATKGDSEWNDEKAGEAIAQAEEKAEGFDSTVDAPVDADGHTKDEAPAAEPEPEDNTKSYAEYLAEQAQKKLELGLGVLDVRKPNENVKQDKKWAAAKELKRVEEEAAYMEGAAGKAKRERQRKEKTVIDIDQRFVEPQRGGFEGRGGRGGRGRGEGRGEFRGGERGRGGGRGRGEFRGGESRGPRGDRGGSGRGGAVNVQDKNAFPSLGNKS